MATEDRFNPPRSNALQRLQEREREEQQEDEITREAFRQVRDRTSRTVPFIQDEPTPTPAEQQEAAEEDGRSLFGDVGLSALSGVARAINENVQILSDLDEFIDANFTEAFGETGGQAARLLIPGLGPAAQAAGDLDDADIELPTTESETLPGALTQGMAQFITGFAGASKLTAGVNFGRGVLGGFTRTSVNSALADATVFDPHEARLSDLVNEFPALQNPVTEFLAADPEDGEIEGRLKNALEGLVVGTLVEPFTLALRGLRNSRQAKKAAKEAALAEEQNLNIDVREEPDIEPDTAGSRSGTDAPEDAAPRADDTAREPEAPNGTRRVIDINVPEQARAAVRVDKGDADAFADLVREGNLSDAADLIDFNPNRIDWESLEDPEQIRQLLNTTSETFDDLINSARGGDEGVQANVTTERLASLVGISARRADSLFRSVREGEGMAARMLAAERTLLASTERLAQLARRAVGGSDADEIAFREHAELHIALQAEVKGTQTEVARSLQILNRVRQGRGAQAIDDLDQDIQSLIRSGPKGSIRDVARKVAEAGGDARKINNFVRRTRFQKFRDGFLEIFINGLLSAPKTVNLNNLSNTLKFADGIAERFLASGVGAVRRGLGQQTQRVRIRETNALAHGAVEGLRDGFFITGRGLQAAGQAARQFARMDVGGAKSLLKDNAEEFGNVWRALGDGAPMLDSRQKVEVLERRAIQTTPEQVEQVFGRAGVRGRGAGWVANAWNLFGGTVRLPGRAVLTSDEVFKNVAYRQELQALALRRAEESADNLQLRGTERRNHIANVMDETLRDPPEDLKLGSMNFARYQTFQEELGRFSKSVENFASQHPGLRVIFPFIRTPANIMRQTLLERSPIGLLRAQIWRDIRQGGPEADRAVARLALGTTTFATAVMFAAEGKITGGGTVNTDRSRNTEDLDNIPPYSLRVGDQWIQYNRLEPLGMLMGLAADTVDIANFFDEGVDPINNDTEDRLGEAMVIGISAVYQNVINKTYMQGAADLLAFARDPKRNMSAGTRQLATWIQPFNSSLIRNLAAHEDPVAREAFGYIEHIKSNIPGLSEDLPPARDWLGDPIPRGQGLGPTWLSPIRMEEEPTDPLRKKMAELAFEFQMPSKSAAGGLKLTGPEYSRLLEIPKELGMQEALRNVVQDDGFNNRPEGPKDIPGTQAFIISDIVSDFRGQANALLEAEARDGKWPSLKEKLERQDQRDAGVLDPLTQE